MGYAQQNHQRAGREEQGEVMENFKLPIALVVAMVLQISGGVWWVSQQAQTIQQLEKAVKEMSSRMAIEENVNMKRDIMSNAEAIEGLFEAANSNSMHMDKIAELMRRVSVIETELKYLGGGTRFNKHPME
jgi:hypothetical protein